MSVKPHASPVLHAINYLLGRLDAALPRRRCAQFGGLQSLPVARRRTPTRSTSRPARSASARPRRSGARSRTATSPGTSTCRAAGARSRCSATPSSTRAPCWEAIADPMVARLGEVLWVVDLNRQSLDRVVPDIAAGRLAGDVRGGRLARGDGQVRPPPARARATAASCAPRSTRCPTRSTSGCCAPTPRELRERLPAATPRSRARSPTSTTTSCCAALPRPRRPRPRRAARRPTAQADAVARPPVASSSPTRSRAGGCRPRATRPTTPRCSPAEQYARARRRRSAPTPEDPWAPFDAGQRRRPSCARPRPQRAARATVRRRARRPRCPRDARPRAHAARSRPSRRSGASSSTSCARRPRSPSASSPSRPTSPPRPTSAAGSTRPGIWYARRPASTGSPTTPTRSCAGARPSTASTSSSASPRSTSSACSASSARPGRATASRCCRSARSTTRSSARALEPWSFGIYAGGQSILVGTPIGRHARPRGRRAPVDHHAVDRHRAAGLRRLGAGLRPGPRVDACCTRSSRLGRPDGDVAPTSGSPRGRSTRRSPASRRTARREAVLAGGYRLRRRPGAAARRRSSAMGAIVPEALAAADTLGEEAGGAEVVCLTSADLRLPRAARRAPGCGDGDRRDPRRGCSRRPRRADRHACSTATRTRSRFLAAVHGVPIACLGVHELRPVGRRRRTSTATTGSTPRRSSAPRSTCSASPRRGSGPSRRPRGGLGPSRAGAALPARRGAPGAPGAR